MERLLKVIRIVLSVGVAFLPSKIVEFKFPHDVAK
jgi:hypothetical protein